MNRTELEKIQQLSSQKHLKNFLKILHFNFWSDDERLFFIWMYDKMIIRKMDWDNMVYTQHLDRFLEILESE